MPSAIVLSGLTAVTEPGAAAAGVQTMLVSRLALLAATEPPVLDVVLEPEPLPEVVVFEFEPGAAVNAVAFALPLLLGPVPPQAPSPTAKTVAAIAAEERNMLRILPVLLSQSPS